MRKELPEHEKLAQEVQELREKASTSDDHAMGLLAIASSFALFTTFFSVMDIRHMLADQQKDLGVVDLIGLIGSDVLFGVTWILGVAAVVKFFLASRARRKMRAKRTQAQDAETAFQLERAWEREVAEAEARRVGEEILKREEILKLNAKTSKQIDDFLDDPSTGVTLQRKPKATEHKVFQGPAARQEVKKKGPATNE